MPPDTSAQRYHALLDVAQAITAHHDLNALCRELAFRLPRIIDVNYIDLSLHDPGRDVMRLHTIQANVPADLVGGHEPSTGEAPAGLVWKTQEPLLVSDITEENRWSEVIALMKEDGTRSFCFVPLTTARTRLGAMGFLSRSPAAYKAQDLQFLQLVGIQVAVAVENALAFQQIAQLKDTLTQANVYLEEELRKAEGFDDIIGDSPALKHVLRQVEVVAPTDSTVLIQGETGTGKELIARATHRLSSRKDRAFVKLNCAAIPTGLLESELFGHERGAFTGAVAQKIGRFEVANHGTIFLDEVGDIPLELQAKLLRVLQEQEFERLGNTKTIRVDVRLIAATNRDLRQLVETNQFRSDLFYRLNVFPITVPPLRERQADIQGLVHFFTRQYAGRMKKPIHTIPKKTLDALTSYAWPGNIRELQNLVERSVILSQGSELHVPLAELTLPSPSSGPAPTTLEETERTVILKALRESHWVIGGPEGAAARLGMKRTTLASRMKKAGIVRPPAIVPRPGS